MATQNQQQLSSTNELRDELVSLVLEGLALEEEIEKNEERLEVANATRSENKSDTPNA
jgi:hypothetical protein